VNEKDSYKLMGKIHAGLPDECDFIAYNVIGRIVTVLADEKNRAKVQGRIERLFKLMAELGWIERVPGTADRFRKLARPKKDKDGLLEIWKSARDIDD